MSIDLAFSTTGSTPLSTTQFLSTSLCHSKFNRFDSFQRYKPIHSPVRCLILEASPEKSIYSPVLILPGLGNCTDDYKQLAQTLTERGHSTVAILPVKRWQWSLNAKGFIMADYWKATLKPNNVLDWYFDIMDNIVDSLISIKPNTSINVIGHSAGGWLFCAYLAERASSNLKVSSLITLGTPHKSPPKGKLDQTRGLLTYIENNCDVSNQVAKFICVAGGGTIGKPFGKGSISEYIAFLSYAAVCGNGAVDGDGVTPITSACARGGKLVVCDSCNHSMLTSKNWYGSKTQIDTWIHYLE